jgi:hypothetical protein
MQRSKDKTSDPNEESNADEESNAHPLVSDPLLNQGGGAKRAGSQDPLAANRMVTITNCVAIIPTAW